MKDNNLTPFEGKEIRKVWHDEQWFFSIIDVIEVLTDSTSPRTYWAKLKAKEQATSGQTFPFSERLKLLASDGRNRLTDCANTEGILRVVMSIPSPKAEPLRLWLAQVGAERIEETENPELSFERAREVYKAKGYPDDWIGYREKSITVRKELTEEWKSRGIKEEKEYSILTATIAKHTFGLTPSEHSELKGVDKKKLRDNMTTLELLFSALSEEITRTMTIKDNARGFYQNQESAIQGGKFTGNAIERLEKEKGIKVVSSDNYLHLKKGDNPDELPPKEE